MIETIAEERADDRIGFREAFHNGKQQTFRRICLGMGANIFQQIGGVNVVAYYLPVVLERSFGFTPRLALILSACDSMQWMFWGAMAMYSIEKFGRKKMMLFGASGCNVCFALIAIGLGVGNKASNGVAVAFIFIFYFFFVSTPCPSVQRPLSTFADIYRECLSWGLAFSILRRSTPTDLVISAPQSPWSRIGSASTSLFRSRQLVSIG